ncbi:hypothetical protein M3Y94_00543400 [Aphelenchoides besseyi]|nr:hypothetical protein M3Y94_00543400 [Aphelenchoides besseyi]KAI6225732.1 M20-dimer domain-containing protein [Aphelenchoides besseyi]
MADKLREAKSIEDFLVELMKIESTTENEGQLAEAIREYMKEKNWHVESQKISSNKKRANLLITRVPYKEAKLRVLFNTHMDTVPEYIPPTVEDGRINGRGSNDAKGQIAAMIFALQKLAENHEDVVNDCGLLLVVGEETDHVGMKEANELNMHPDYLIVGEPTELKFGHAQKGALKIRLDAKGKAAHSGYPERGESAINKLLDVLSELRSQSWDKCELMGETTMNIGKIEGGQALNALAEKASASLFFRVAKSAAAIMERVKKIGKAHGVEVVELGLNEPVQLTKPPKPYDSYTVAFNTDIPYYSRKSDLKGLYLFGAGSITNAHSADEFIEIEDLKKAVDVHVDLVLKLLEKCD